MHTLQDISMIEEHTKLRELELEILGYSGLKPNTEIRIFDVEIDFNGPNFIHTITCGNQSKETLVLVHGYGGCGALFYPMLESLSSNFRVFCIDLLGMGLSSRPDYKYETTEEAIDFFVGSIEKWREALGLEELYLAGHSLGGYISVQYAVKYQKHIKKMFLISPAGITKDQQKTIIKHRGWFGKAFQQVKHKMGFKKSTRERAWEEHLTPHTLFVRHPIITKYLLRKYLKKMYGQKGKEQRLVELLTDYFIGMVRLPESSEKAIYKILKSPLGFAHVPLEDIIIDNLDIPVNCYYGAKDWMDWSGADRISREKSTFVLKTIDHAGHQVQSQNPKALSEEILLCV